MRRMLAPPFVPEGASIRDWRKLSMLKILDWLELHPGATWQQRWDAYGAETAGTADWRDQMLADLEAAGNYGTWAGGTAPQARHRAGPADRRRRHPPGPALAADHHLPGPGRRRDGPGPRPRRDHRPCKALREAAGTGHATFDPAVERVALIMAAKGGLVADITPGDCIELLDCCPGRCSPHGPAPTTGTARSSTSSCTRPGPSRPAPRPRSG